MRVDARLSQECLSYMLAEGGWKTVWKELIVDVHNEMWSLRSPHWGDFTWEPGWLEATNEPDDPREAPAYAIVYQDQQIAGDALHAYFLDPRERPRAPLTWQDNAAIVPLRARAEDFIAAGTNGACIVATFRRLYLGYRECEVAVKESTEQQRISREDREKLWQQHMEGIASVSTMPVEFQRLAKSVGQQQVAQLQQHWGQSLIDPPQPNVLSKYLDAVKARLNGK
jgi:hypothetical protein